MGSLYDEFKHVCSERENSYKLSREEQEKILYDLIKNRSSVKYASKENGTGYDQYGFAARSGFVQATEYEDGRCVIMFTLGETNRYYFPSEEFEKYFKEF